MSLAFSHLPLDSYLGTSSSTSVISSNALTSLKFPFLIYKKKILVSALKVDLIELNTIKRA